MVLPLFTRSVGVQVRPTDLPVEALSPWRSFQEGVNLAQKLPTTELAIARGIQGAVDVYNKNRAADVAIQREEIGNKQEQLKLETAQQIQPEAIEAARLKLQADKDKYAEDIRLGQQQEELNSILAGSDQNAKVDAIIGGKFVELFAKEKGLEDSAARAVFLQLPPELRDQYSSRYSSKKAIDAQTEWDRRQAEQRLVDYNRKLGELGGNQAIKNHIAAFPGMSELEAARDIEIKPYGSVEIDDAGYVVTDPSTKDWKVVTTPDPLKLNDINSGKYSVAFSKSTRKVTNPKLDNKERDKLADTIRAAEGAYRATGVGNGLYNGVEDTSNRGKFLATVHKTLGDQQPTQQPTIADIVTENAAVKANQPPPVAEGVTTIPLDKMPAYLDKIPLIDDKGAVQLSNELTQIVVARTLGIPIEAAKQQKAEIDALLTAHSLDTPDITKMASADALIKSALRSEFRTNPVTINKYTQENVDRYNASTLDRRIMLERAGEPVPPPVNSSEDMYVMDNYSRMATRLDSMLDSINRSAIKQQQAIAMKGLQGPRAREVLQSARGTK